MPKPVTLTFTFPHTLATAEVRRRLDLHTAWTFRQFAREKIAIEADDWFGERRAFLASGYGMKAGPRSRWPTTPCTSRRWCRVWSARSPR